MTARDMTEFSTLQEMLLLAHERLTPELWDFINGATESETTARRNRAALDRLTFRPRVLRDVSRLDTSTKFLGRVLSIPVMMAPVGSLALIDPGGATLVARACAAAGTLMFYSTFADPPLDEVHQAVSQPVVLALYVRGDQNWLDKAIEEAKAAKCFAIAVVTEAAYYSRRERDLMNQFRSRGSKSGTYAATQRLLRDRPEGDAFNAAHARMEPARLTWRTIERIRARSGLPIILKGIATREDAALAVDAGVDAIYVSNHGGRQLDHAAGSADALPEIVEAVAGRAEVIVDGGICRGTDVVKAIALGARAACIGRLQCWALAAGGEVGLLQALAILEEEIIITMGLLGVTRLDELRPEHLRGAEPIEPADLLNPFPVAKEVIARARGHRLRRVRDGS
jgi:isopentenyl diphosphate isomerase/L-lactate dehydrogenase-like FMN-dependent dehydrogenase